VAEPSLPTTRRRVAIPPLADVSLPTRGPIERLGGETMGTTWSVLLVAPAPVNVAALGPAIRQELDGIVAQMSPWLDASDISRFNRASARSVHSLPEPFFTVLAFALATARDSDGAYDPTVGPLVDLWGFGPASPRAEPPSPAEIDAVRGRVGWDRIALDAAARTAVQPGGVAVDLSAVAKGYAVDRVAALLRSRHAESFLVEIGGELRGEGVKPDGQPWWVSLERPGRGAARGEEIETVVALYQASVATSGDYRKYFDHGGVRYAHTIDPRTARPVAHDLASVSVVHADCMAADALSTALYVMGADAGLAFAAARNIAALFVRRVNGELVETPTPAFTAMLE